MGIKLGMTDPSFASISRSLKVLLSNNRLEDFEVVRNGLGLNNILYISMLLEYFERRSASTQSAGQLLLIEEPEAHLHPQLQRVLYATLASKPFQSILSTHSTHISSLAPFESFITLSRNALQSSANLNRTTVRSKKGFVRLRMSYGSQVGTPFYPNNFADGLTVSLIG